VLVRADRSDLAQRQLETILARTPDHTGAVERLAAMDAKAGAWDRATDAYGRLVTIIERRCDVDGAALPSAVLAFADACDRAGRPGDARDALERAIVAVPDHEDLRRCLERVCELGGDWKRLSALLAARAERTSDAPEKATLLLQAASLLVPEDRDAKAALHLIETARTVHPESIEAALAYARVQTTLGRPQDALPPLTEIVERNAGKRWPLLASVYLELGKAHLAIDELAEAFDALKAGFAIDVRIAEMAMLLGLVALDLGDEKTAERALLAVVTLPPRKETSAGDDGVIDTVAALCHLASIAQASGDLVKARRWASKAVREDPTHEGAQALLGRLTPSEPSAVALGR
jgi:tetratricopeptide (TPR) repeat protein